jgi:hypothetical protein
VSDPRVINLSLISHTNAGKTTLARTLLGRDVGEVRDAPHVTDMSDAYPMIATPDGCALRLWDTPGFGDSARLLRRLKNAQNPLGWVLAQVWDRYADRPLWCSQQAMRNVRDEADVVLYLVNAAEAPEDAGYVRLEMEILTWLGRPTILLLNQTGPPRDAAAEHADQQRWAQHLSGYAIIKVVLGLDAFARCWVQEGELLEHVGRLLAAHKQPCFSRLAVAWRDKNLERFQQAMAIVARQLAQAAADRENLGSKPWSDKAREYFRSLFTGHDAAQLERERAMAALAERLDGHIRTATESLIALHGLSGHAAQEIMRRLTDDYAASAPLSEGFIAALGGFVTGALGGLAADLAAGGLSFGAGVVGGGLLGALGAGGIARGYNLVTGKDTASIRWSEAFLNGLVRSALLRYLAVAHFGRGRGDYAEGEHPKFWQSAVAAMVDARREQVRLLWELGGAHPDPAPLAAAAEALCAECAAALLEQFYPDAERIITEAPGEKIDAVATASLLQRDTLRASIKN